MPPKGETPSRLSFGQVLEEYAEDEALLSTDFGKAFKKLTELGCPFASVEVS